MIAPGMGPEILRKKCLVGISLFFLGIHLFSLSGDHPYKPIRLRKNGNHP
jgi:hypothetical protein